MDSGQKVNFGQQLGQTAQRLGQTARSDGLMARSMAWMDGLMT